MRRWPTVPWIPILVIVGVLVAPFLSVCEYRRVEEECADSCHPHGYSLKWDRCYCDMKQQAPSPS